MHSRRTVSRIFPEPPAAVTLLLHHESLYEEYIRNNSSIALRTLDGGIANHGGYDVELHKNGTWQTPSPTLTLTPANKTNNNLIVTVKATQTVSALRALKSRLSPSSTVLFIQNGCGMIDYVNELLFEDPGTRRASISACVNLNRIK